MLSIIVAEDSRVINVGCARKRKPGRERLKFRSHEILKQTHLSIVEHAPAMQSRDIFRIVVKEYRIRGA
jgi:hypothetical protein